MSDNIAQRPQLTGLISIVIAIVIIGATFLAELGFDRSFTRLQQLSLLLAAAVLWVVHMPPLGGRYWRRRPAVRKITQSFKNRNREAL
jgi:hypothetical protein